MRAHDRAQVALDSKKDSREGKAAFVAVLFAFLRDDLRIDQSDALRRIFAARTVHYEKAFGYADLHRGQADAWRGVHRFEQVVDEFLEVFVEFRDRIGRSVKHGIWPGNDFQ